MFFGLRRALRPVLRAGLRAADGLGQYLAQLSLRLRRRPRKARFSGHGHYVGMPDGEVNATGTANQGQPTSAILRIIHVRSGALNGLD
jgi:hypothetical protein